MAPATTATSAKPESTIAPYYTDLNGVDLDLNILCTNILWGTLGLVIVFVMAVRIMESVLNRMRQSSILCSSEESQTSWMKPRTVFGPKVKKHLIYASLWNKRHHREYRFLSMNFGTLPSRLHAAFLLLYLASNIAYMALLTYNTPNRWAIFAELRGRSGTLCVANFIPLVILAGRNNPLIHLLRISFDTYNLFHRWIGRIAIAEMVVHVVAWMIPVVADGGWSLVRRKLGETLFLASGLTGLICMLLIFFLTLSPFRHAFYETFLNIHVLLAAFVFICTWLHCASASVSGGLPQLPWIIAVVHLWAADRAARIARVVYLTWPPCRKEAGSPRTNATCEALPGEVTRVTVALNRFVNIKPGTHAYLRVYGVRTWESHPFSIAWVDHDNYDGRGKASPTPEQHKELPYGKAAETRGNTYASFLIAARSGWTRTLFEKARSCPQGLRVMAFMEGPYAGYHDLHSYGHLLLFAGAGGITHQISYARPLIEGSVAGLVATRRLTLVWIVRDLASLEWVRPHLDELQSMPGTAEMLRIKIFVTGRDNQHGTCPSGENPMIQVFRGRPDIPSVLDEELGSQIGAMCVSVCGPGGLADDVRGAVRAAQGATVVDFIEESFTW